MRVPSTLWAETKKTQEFNEVNLDATMVSTALFSAITSRFMLTLPGLFVRIEEKWWCTSSFTKVFSVDYHLIIQCRMKKLCIVSVAYKFDGRKALFDNFLQFRLGSGTWEQDFYGWIDMQLRNSKVVGMRIRELCEDQFWRTMRTEKVDLGFQTRWAYVHNGHSYFSHSILSNGDDVDGVCNSSRWGRKCRSTGGAAHGESVNRFWSYRTALFWTWRKARIILGTFPFTLSKTVLHFAVAGSEVLG